MAERRVFPSDLAQRYRTTRRSVPHRYRRENMWILYSVDTARQSDREDSGRRVDMPSSRQIACNTDVLDLKRSEDARNSLMVEIKEAMEGCDTLGPIPSAADLIRAQIPKEARMGHGPVLSSAHSETSLRSASRARLSSPILASSCSSFFSRQFPCSRAVVPGIQCQKLPDLLKRETGRLRLFYEK